jgi:hypothetical protein
MLSKLANRIKAFEFCLFCVCARGIMEFKQPIRNSKNKGEWI